MKGGRGEKGGCDLERTLKFHKTIIHCLDSDGKKKETGFSSLRSLPTAFLLQSVLPDPTHNNNNVCYFYKTLNNFHTRLYLICITLRGWKEEIFPFLQVRTLKSRESTRFAQSHTGSELRGQVPWVISSWCCYPFYTPNHVCLECWFSNCQVPQNHWEAFHNCTFIDSALRNKVGLG